MAHGSHSAQDYEKSLELGYQQDQVNISALMKFLVGLGVFTLLSLVLMYGLKVALEYQAAEEDRANANPMAFTDKERAEGKQLPPEPRLQAAPGFGVTRFDGTRVRLENYGPQSEYLVLRGEWDKVLAEGLRDEKTGTVIVLPIEEGKKQYLAKQPPVRGLEGVKEPEGDPLPEDTSAGRIPGAATHAMTEAPAEGGATPKEAGAKPEGATKPSPTATPAAKAAGAGRK